MWFDEKILTIIVFRFQRMHPRCSTVTVSKYWNNNNLQFFTLHDRNPEICAQFFYTKYLHNWIVGWGYEIFPLARSNIQAGYSAMFSKDYVSYFRSIYDFPIRKLSVSGQSQYLTFTRVKFGPYQRWGTRQRNPLLQAFQAGKVSCVTFSYFPKISIFITYLVMSQMMQAPSALAEMASISSLVNLIETIFPLCSLNVESKVGLALG